MKTLIFFLTLLLSIASVSAVNSYANVAEGGGSLFGTYVNGKYSFPSVPQTMRSAASNQISNKKATGFNPYLITSTPSTGRTTSFAAHINRNSALANEVYKDPSLLLPRYSTNHNRELKAFNPNGYGREYIQNVDKGQGYFNIFHSRNTVTGRIRGAMPDFSY